MKTLDHVKSILIAHKPELFEKYPIKSLAIFGSYARNNYHADSDIDLLVEFNDKIGIRFVDLAEELESLIKSKIDLVSKKALQEKYYQAIQKDLIYV